MDTTLTLLPRRSFFGKEGGVLLSKLDRMDASMWMVTGRGRLEETLCSAVFDGRRWMRCLGGSGGIGSVFGGRGGASCCPLRRIGEA